MRTVALFSRDILLFFIMYFYCILFFTVFYLSYIVAPIFLVLEDVMRASRSEVFFLFQHQLEGKFCQT